MGWISRLRRTLGKQRLAQDHEEELEFHRSMREQWNVDRGLPREEAHRDASVRFGSKAAWRERMSEIDLMLFPQTVWQDLRYGARMMLRNYGFTIAAVLALAIGIGANTAVFTIYKAFFLRKLEGADVGRLVNVAINLQSGGTAPWLSIPDFEAYRQGVHAFAGITAVGNAESLTLTGAGGLALSHIDQPGSLISKLGFLPLSHNAERASVLIVTNNYFSVLGVSTIRGRTFTDDDQPQTDSVLPALISENYWQSRLWC